MKHIGKILVLFLIPTFCIWAYSQRERKREFDSDSKVLQELYKALPAEMLEEEMENLEALQSELDMVFRAGTSKQKEELLDKGESFVAKLQKNWIARIHEISEELVTEFGSRVELRQRMEKPKKINPDSKEKSIVYSRMAREELNTGEKFQRDGNLGYAIVVYKRSIVYSLHALKEIGEPLPKRYRTAVLLDPKYPKSWRAVE